MMDTPRILAIDDVHLFSPLELAARLVAFYTDLIGLDRVEAESDEHLVALRGYPRSGPRLIVNLADMPAASRRPVLIQIASLADCADQMTELRIAFRRSQGWTFYDRQLHALDPAGNRVELVVHHYF